MWNLFATLPGSWQQDVWHDLVELDGWNWETCTFLDHALRSDTMKGYNGYFTRYLRYVKEKFPGQSPLPPSTAAKAGFMDWVTRNTTRPTSTLLSVSAMFACISQSPEGLIDRLRKSLVNLRTTAPKKVTQTFPIRQALDYLLEHSPNSRSLGMEQSREKAIVLLAICEFGRPHDLASAEMEGKIELAVAKDDSYLRMSIIGSKPDSCMDGFYTNLYRCSDVRLCPVEAIVAYRCLLDVKAKEKGFQVPDNLFCAINSPCKALGEERISKILTLFLQKVGYPQLTAKSFRPSAANAALENNIHPDVVLMCGRWADPKVFVQHYLRTTKPSNFTDSDSILFAISEAL
eukprot:Lithocolla_globosa_v1_NODE_442_length_4041_cov_30.407677.p3 type:complete len:346 gc:universal NODE_442_length_4041_cov_30.407677:1256-219(-)